MVCVNVFINLFDAVFLVCAGIVGTFYIYMILLTFVYFVVIFFNRRYCNV